MPCSSPACLRADQRLPFHPIEEGMESGRAENPFAWCVNSSSICLIWEVYVKTTELGHQGLFPQWTRDLGKGQLLSGALALEPTFQSCLQTMVAWGLEVLILWRQTPHYSSRGLARGPLDCLSSGAPALHGAAYAEKPGHHLSGL